MLNNFFRINLPYGLKEENGTWKCFNREYFPLGFNALSTMKKVSDTQSDIKDCILTPYKNLDEKLILFIVDNDSNRIHRNDEGRIDQFFLYQDATNPFNSTGQQRQELWDLYCEKLQYLAELNVSETMPVM